MDPNQYFSDNNNDDQYGEEPEFDLSNQDLQHDPAFQGLAQGQLLIPQQNLNQPQYFAPQSQFAQNPVQAQPFALDLLRETPFHWSPQEHLALQHPPVHANDPRATGFSASWDYNFNCTSPVTFRAGGQDIPPPQQLQLPPGNGQQYQPGGVRQYHNHTVPGTETNFQPPQPSPLPPKPRRSRGTKNTKTKGKLGKKMNREYPGHMDYSSEETGTLSEGNVISDEENSQYGDDEDVAMGEQSGFNSWPAGLRTTATRDQARALNPEPEKSKVPDAYVARIFDRVKYHAIDGPLYPDFATEWANNTDLASRREHYLRVRWRPEPKEETTIPTSGDSSYMRYLEMLYNAASYLQDFIDNIESQNKVNRVMARKASSADIMGAVICTLDKMIELHTVGCRLHPSADSTQESNSKFGIASFVGEDGFKARGNGIAQRNLSFDERVRALCRSMSVSKAITSDCLEHLKAWRHVASPHFAQKTKGDNNKNNKKKGQNNKKRNKDEDEDPDQEDPEGIENKRRKQDEC